MVADSTVARIAFAEPAVSPAADAQNSTRPAPPPPPPIPPPDEPQRPVEPGIVAQGWNDSSFAPTQVAELRDVAMRDSGNETSYETTYGNFVLDQSAPYFVRLLSPGPSSKEIAESAFLVLYQGRALLSPGNGDVDRATSEDLAFHYDLHLSTVTMGTMTVDYRFQPYADKITISFSPSVGRPEQYQIVWLTFTSWDAVDTAYPSDIEQRVEDLHGEFGSLYLGPNVGTLYGTGTIEIPGAVIRPDQIAGSSGGPEIRMDASDAADDFSASYAGSDISFGGHSGNAVLSAFLPGHLAIDPQLLLSGQPQDAVSHSGVTRRTFYDGDRYWSFSKLLDGKSIRYSSSVDGRTWVAGSQYVVTTGGALSNGFTVINYGKMVGVLWIDSGSSKAIQLRTGLIGLDQIQWDDAGHQLYSGGNDITRPVSATFTSQGNAFVTTWGDSGGGIGTATYKCTGQGSSGFSSCATQTAVGSVDWGGSSPSYSLVVPFNGIDAVARVMVHSFTGFFGDQHAQFSVKVFYSTGTSCPEAQFTDTGQDLRDAWIADGLFTATPVGSDVNIFFRSSGSTIGNWLVSTSCVARQQIDVAAGTATYLTAGTDQTGNATYLFYTESGNIRYARVIPYSVYVTSVTIPPSLSVYTSPFYLSAAQFARRFIPLMFTRAYPPPQGISDGCTSSYCLYYVNFPLPLDGEASVNNPWALKLGAPLVTDVGGSVSPTTGLLAVNQVLVAGSPSIGLIYREPGLFYRTSSGYDDSYLGPQAHPIMPGIYYDLPWIAGTTLHMQGGQQFPLILTGMAGNLRWFNSTRGVRYTLMLDTSSPTYRYTLTYPSGAYVLLDFISGSSNEWHISKAYLDTTGNNYVTYNVDFGITGTIVDSSGRTITLGPTCQPGSTCSSITYGNGQSIGLVVDYSQLCTGGTSSDSGTLSVIDTIGRVTRYTVCHWQLTKLESSKGGRVDYTYATYSATPGTSNQVWQGTDVYSLPVLKMDIYNESGANLKARSLVFNWNFQNGEVIRAVVNITDKSAVVQGSKEYIFNPAAGVASVRTYDSAGQVIYFDMQSLNGANMKDLSGNTNDGLLVGTLTDTTGRYGRAREAAGIGKYVDILSPVGLPSTTLAVSAWVKLNAPVNWINIANHNWLNAAGTWVMAVGSASTVLFGFTPDGTTQDTVSSAALTSGYHSVIGTIDGASGTVTLYVDGVRSATHLYSSVTLATSGFLTFMDQSVSGGNIDLDEVHVYNRLLSPEDVGILYTTNALKRGARQNWYSINDMPHLSEGFAGDETSPSVVAQDAIDDWGNQIYSRDPLGNEAFASYANTNHQSHFYAQGRLSKESGPIFNTEFFDFSNGVFPPGGSWTVATTFNPPPHPDYGNFDKVAPSLVMGVPSSGTTNLTHILTATSPTFLEFRARQNAVGRFEIRLGTSSSYNVGIRFTTSGTIEAYDRSTNAWHGCTLPGGGSATYTTFSWSRISVIFTWPYKTYLNGIDLACGSPSNLGGQTQINFEAFGPGYVWSAWLDDIKIYHNDCNDPHCQSDAVLDIGFDGLQPRQSVSLISEDGSVIDQAVQTGAGAVWLSFNSALTGAYAYYENGDNAKTAVKIYAEDGTLEYQSPIRRFFVGQRYAYARPRTFADELVKTTSGALCWIRDSCWGGSANPIYADEKDPSGNCFVAAGFTIGCYGTWTWQQSPNTRALRGSYVHTTQFDFGTRFHYFTITPAPNIPTYFVTYILIPEGRTPDGIGLLVEDTDKQFCSTCWSMAYWGAQPSISENVVRTFYMGPVPSARNQWIALVAKSADFMRYINIQWDKLGYALAGGEAEWDVTSTNSIATWLTVGGLSGLGANTMVSVYDPTNNVVVTSGPNAGDSAAFSIYRPSSAYNWDSFPVQANIKICQSTSANGCDGSNLETAEYYFGPLRNIWPGDTFRYAGSSAFFDLKSSSTTYWPSPSVHTAQIGGKKFSGDCISAILCYDMETIGEGATTLDTGVVATQMTDLSGKGSHGTFGGTPKLSSISQAAAGLGTTFNAGSDEIAFTLPSIDTVSGHWNTVSFWMYWTGTASQMPFGFNLYDLYFASTYFGFNTGNGDIWGIDNTGLTNSLVHVAAEFYNGAGTTSKLYINGVPKTLSQKLGATLSRTATTNAKLSGWPYSSAYKFGGTIDQVQVFNRALTDTEVLVLYQTRMPGAPQVYFQPTNSPAGSGLVRSSRAPSESAFLYAVATYDSKGNVLSVTDTGRSTSGGSNVTTYAYSTKYQQDFLTQVTRPDGKQTFYAYDFQTGVKLGILDIDCRRSRTQYDAVGRPTQTLVYDQDPTEVLHIDMETSLANGLKDVSCAGTADSRSGQNVGDFTQAFAPGIEGQARLFAGSGSSYQEISRSATLEPSRITVSAWIRPSVVALSDIVDKSYPDSTGSGYVLLLNADGSAQFTVYGGGASGISATTAAGAVTANNWYHLVGTYDGSYVRIYVNAGTPASTSYTGGISYNDAYRDLFVGVSYGANSRFFSGSIDEVRVFNVALSSSSISDLWKFKYKLLTSSSVAYDDMTAWCVSCGNSFSGDWTGYTFPSVTTYDGVSVPRSLYFDMQTMKLSGLIGVTNTVEDLSGNGNHGTIQGTPASVAGKVGQALQFTSSLTQWLDIHERAKAPSLDITGSLTVAAWINPSGVGTIDPIFAKGYATSLQYYLDVHKSGTSWYLGVQLKNVAGTIRTVNSATSVAVNAWTHVAFTYDGSTIKLYVNGGQDANTGTLAGPLATSVYDATVAVYPNSPTTYFYDGVIDELQVIASALRPAEISSFYNGYGTGTFDASHLSRSYSDGLGRDVRQLTMNMYGAKIQTVATLGWNDQPIYAYTPSGGYFAYTYDFVGRTLTAATPGGSTLAGVSANIVSEKARTIESVDAVGRKGYSKTDVLGRSVETAVWNASSLAYGNVTSATYNALSKTVASTDGKGQTTTTYYNSLGKPKMTVFPDGTYSVVYYDDNLRAYQTVDLMGRVAVSAYDSLGRVTSVTMKPSLSSGTSYVATYGYDPVHDDLLTVDNITAKVTYTYDSLHRVKTERLDVPSSSPVFAGTVTYTYDNASKVTDIQYPAGLNSMHAVYVYDSLGRIGEVDYGGSTYAVLTYDFASRLANIRYWQGATDTLIQQDYLYDARDRVQQIKVFKFGTSTTYMRLYYGYNRASDITNSTDDLYANGGSSNAKAITYLYDGNGRLAQAIGPYSALLDGQGDHTQEYECYDYDQVGNLGHWKTGSSSCSTSYTYAVSGWNRLDSFSFNSMSFTYNTAGSIATKVESGSTTTYTHDFQQELVNIVTGSSTYTYSYDGLGRRVKTVDPSATSYFMYAGRKMLYSKVGTTESAFIYAGDILLLRKEGTGSTPEARYYHSDFSGNVRLVTFYKASNPNRGINVDAKYRYKPFGDIIVLTSPSADPRFKFGGTEFDGSTLRLYHMGARYYDPVVGRFLGRDPVGDHGYVYALDDPLTFRDPLGLDAISDFFGWLRGRGSSAVQATQNAWNGAVNWWNGLDPNVRGAIIIVAVAAAIILTGGLAAGPLAGTALGAILGSAAVGATIGAVSSAAIYTGVTVATGGQWSLEGMAQASAIGAFVGGVTGGAGKAIQLARIGALGARAGSAAVGLSEDEVETAVSSESRLNHAWSTLVKSLDREGIDPADLGLSGKSWGLDREAFTTLNREILTDPDATFPSALRQTQGVTGFAKTVNGVRLVSFAYGPGQQSAGLLATTAVELPSQSAIISAVSSWWWWT